MRSDATSLPPPGSVIASAEISSPRSAGFTKRALNQAVCEHVEIRFALLPEFWGRGYASEITESLITFGFETLKLDMLAAAHGVTNDKSARVLRKNGFRYIKTIVLDGLGVDNATKVYLVSRRHIE